MMIVIVAALPKMMNIKAVMTVSEPGATDSNDADLALSLLF